MLRHHRQLLLKELFSLWNVEKQVVLASVCEARVDDFIRVNCLHRQISDYMCSVSYRLVRDKLGNRLLEVPEVVLQRADV